MAEGVYASATIPISGHIDPSIIRHDINSAIPPDSSRERLSSMSNVLLAGGVGGAVGDSIMFPLDTVKTRQQGAPTVLKYRSMTKASLTILREEGLFRGLYGGYTPALLGSFPATMAFFGAYEYTKRLFIIDYAFNETFTHLAAGFIGDLASSFIYVPSEVLKTRLQLQGRHNNQYFNSGYNYRGMIDAVKTIIRTEGSGALFYGYRATLIRDLPFSAFQFAFYEKLRLWAQRFVGIGNDMSVGLELMTGGLAGGLAGVITTPLDVVKTRVQTQHSTVISSSGPAVLSNSTVGALTTVYRTEGIRGIFSGVGPRLFWTSIQSSIMLLIYQTTLRMLDENNSKTQNPL